jgi:hypothetical protein
VLDIKAALLPLNTTVAAAAPLSPPTSITIPQPQSPSSDVLADFSEPALRPLSGSDPTPTSKGVDSNTGAPAAPAITQQEAYDKMQELLAGAAKTDPPGARSPPDDVSTPMAGACVTLIRTCARSACSERGRAGRCGCQRAGQEQPEAGPWDPRRAVGDSFCGTAG